MLKSIDSDFEIKSIDDFISFLKNLDETYKLVDDELVKYTGFEKFISEFNTLKTTLNRIKVAPRAEQMLRRLAPQINTTAAIEKLQSMHVFDKHSTKQVLDMVTQKELVMVMQQLPIETIDYLTRNYNKYMWGSMTQAEGERFIKYLQGTFNKLQPHVVELSEITGDNTFKKLAKDMTRITELAESGHESIMNNFQNIRRALESHSKVLDKIDDILTLDEYSRIFYNVDDTLGTLNLHFNTNLYQTLQKAIDFKPSETLKFTDTELFNWMQHTNYRYNSLRQVISNTDKIANNYTSDVATHIYEKNAMKRIKALQDYQSSTHRTLMQYQYDMPTVQAMGRKLLKKVEIFNPDDLDAIPKYFEKLKETAKTHNIILSEMDKVYLTNLKDAMKVFKDTLNNLMKNKSNENVFKAQYYTLRESFKDIMENYNRVRPKFDRPSMLADIDEKAKLHFKTVEALRNVTPDYNLSKIVDDIAQMDLGILEHQQLILETDTDYFYAKLENAAVQAHLNNNTVLRSFFQDPEIRTLMHQVKNLDHPSIEKLIKSKWSEEDIRLLKVFSALDEGIHNQNIMWKELDNMLSTMTAKIPKEIPFKQAIYTTINNFKNKRIDYIDPYDMVTQMIYSMQGFINGSDVFMKKQNIDTILRETKTVYKEFGEDGKVIAEVDEVLDALKKSDITEGNYRHSSVYDTAAQIIAWEKKHGNKMYRDVMLDIETTDLLTANKISNGKVTEITMMRRKSKNELEIVFHEKVQLPEEIIKSEYNMNPVILDQMGIKQHYFKNLIQPDGDVTEATVLSNFVEAIQQLPFKQTVHTFNGDEFDWVYLSNKLGKDNVNVLLEHINPVDYYKELSKDKFIIPGDVVVQLKEWIQHQIDRQESLKVFEDALGIRTKFVTGVGSDTLDAFRSFMDLESILQKRNISTTYLKQYEELQDIMSELFGDESYDIHFEILDAIKNLNIDTHQIFKEALSPRMSEMLWNSYEALVSDIRDVGYLNNAWRDILIPSYLLDAGSPKYNQEALMELQRQIADSLPDPTSAIAEQLRTTPMTNLSQLMYAGLDEMPIAYRRLSYHRLNNLDLSEIVLDNNNAPVLDNFAKAIEKVNNNTRNLRILKKNEETIYNMAQELKDSRLLLESLALPIDPDHLQYTYAGLEVLWHKILYTASMGSSNRATAEKLVSIMRKKYPEVVTLLDGRVASAKAFVNGNHLTFNFPSYVNTQKAIEFGKVTSLEDIQQSIKSKIDASIKTSEYNLKGLQNLRTAGTIWQDAYNEYFKTFKDGEKTAQTLAYDKVAQNYQKVMFAWEHYAEMNLTDEELFRYVVNANKDHTHIMYKSSNKYFNNRNMFDNFLTRKKDLEAVGLKLEYNRELEYVKLSISNDINVKVNKNFNANARYVVNGEEVLPVRLAEIPSDRLLEYMGDADKTWFTHLQNIRTKMLELNPDLAGHPGVTNYAEQYNTIRKNKIFKVKDSVGDDYMPYFNTDASGDMNRVIETIGLIDPNYFFTESHLLNKMLNHSHKHYDFGEFIMQGGLKLNSEAMTALGDEGIRELLTQDKSWVAVYLKENPRAIGGFELAKLNSFSSETLAEARRLNATIIPWDSYTEAAKAINNFTYGNKALAVWHKVIQMYKQSWLVNTGVFLRNMADSTMKNFGEGNTVPETLKSYWDAQGLLHKYDMTLREIKKMDPLGKFRLTNAEEYFNKPNTMLDKETYHFIYDFMEKSGMNSIRTNVDGIFGVAMKPNSQLERISRLSMYLNLKGQGKDYSEIMRRIAETHFNYDTKTYGQFLASHYIPFVTYTMNNIMYLVHLVEENPSFLRHYFNAYTPIWDFDGMNYEELSENTSLQYQIMNGNIPLSFFGYEDKEITRIVNTKYGPKEQTVKNTAVLKMGASILDALGFFINPIHNIKEKLAPPVQMLADTVSEFTYASLGNSEIGKWLSYEDTETNYQQNFGSSSIQSLFRDPTNLLELAPGFAAMIPDENLQSLAAIGMGIYNKFDQSKTYERTENELLSAFPSAFGATARWGEFKDEDKIYPKYKRSYGSYSGARSGAKIRTPRTWKYYPKKYYPKRSYARKTYPKRTYAKKVYANRVYAATPNPGQGVIYRSRPGGRYSTYYTGYASRTYTSGKTPYSKYQTFIYNISHPNVSHNRAASFKTTNMQTIPQYLYSFGGRNRQGNSKMLSWLRMPTRYKVKSTLRRFASP